MKTTVLLVIDHKKPIADLPDIAAGRVYNLDGVEDVTWHHIPGTWQVVHPIPKPGFWERVWSRA